AGFINEHRHVVVMFVRFGGFDYDGDPRVSARLQAYFAAVVERIQRYDGYLNKIDMGDKGSKYIVLFGAPVAHEDDAERALRCALELRDLAPGTTAIGVNAGLVFSGLVGSNRRQEYTVMGDPVNLAARLMQAAGHGQIMVGDNARPAGGGLSWAELPALQVKGKSAPVRVWALEGFGQAAAPTISEPRPRLPLVGREAELALAGERLRQVAGGRPAILGITAEAGMGKSRLGSAVLDQARRHGLAVFAGACQSFGTRTGYLVWHTIWREFFGLDPHGSLAEHAERLGQALARIDRRLLPRLPLLGPPLNLPLPDNEFTGALDGQLRTELTRALLLACLRARSFRQPLLFVLEDMHWSDSLSLDLLEFLARVGDNRPVAFLLIYRPLDGDHPIKRLMRLGHASEISLAEFSPAEAASLIRLKLTQHFGPDQAMPDVLVERINGRAGGNPFFIEELINYIRDRGIDPSDPAALAALDLPNSLHNVIISRIDQLLSEEKITLKVASVIGRLFRASWLWGGYPSLGSPDKVKGRLTTLSELDLTPLDKPEPELEYIFKHITTQEVAYESLALATRTQLHGAIAGFVEQAYPDALEQYVSLLAFHYGRSGDAAKQVAYFRLAADQAKANYANGVAIEYYTRLLPLLPPAERSPVQRELGEVRQLIGQWPEAEADYRQALALAQAHGDESGAAHAQTLLGRLLAQTASHAEALGWLEPARATFERLGDAAGLGKALEHLSFVYSEQGQFAAALEVAERHLALARAQGDSRGIAAALGNLGLVHIQQGNLEQALAAQREALEVATQHHYWRGMVLTSNDLARIYWQQGDLYNAILSLQNATSVAHEIDYREAFAFALSNMGLLYSEQGFFDQALACYGHALAIFIEPGAWANALASISNVGLLWMEERDFARAELCYTHGRSIAEKLGTESRLAGLQHYIALLHYEQNHLAQARQANNRALALAKTIQRGDII
ncbi:MAG TPA: tetratricopeptide repeat protein, partial [Herpetosiphonaceae bacterium]|nr:tetratricopeptide repeat protein [Herpetosiphonaceae bacterium]